MRYFRAFNLLLMGCAVLCVVSAQETTVKRIPAHPTASIGGKDLFQEYCAVCHGVNGKGAGPAASALKKAPPDLTQMARVHGGKFPEAEVLKMLQGEVSIISPGAGEMPI